MSLPTGGCLAIIHMARPGFQMMHGLEALQDRATALLPGLANGCGSCRSPESPRPARSRSVPKEASPMAETYSWTTCEVNHRLPKPSLEARRSPALPAHESWSDLLRFGAYLT